MPRMLAAAAVDRLGQVRQAVELKTVLIVLRQVANNNDGAGIRQIVRLKNSPALVLREGRT